MKTTLPLMAGLLVLSLNLQAQTTWYMTPSGTGARNGTSWSNAFSGTSNANFVNIITGTMQPGDTLLIGGSEQPWVDRTAVTGTNTVYHLPPLSQTYTNPQFSLTGAASGTPTARKTIKGVARGYGLPVFFNTGARNYTSISLTEDCSYLTFEDLDIRRPMTAIAATGTLPKNGLEFRGISVFGSAISGLSFDRCTNLLVENCTATKYTQTAFWVRFGSDKVTFRNCIADCTMGENDSSIASNWINKSDKPIGFHFHEKNKPDEPINTNILLENCTSKNNFGRTGQGTYYQGDGFMVQVRNVGITFRKCIADGATDSGYDLKGTDETINDSVATNCEKSGVKIWKQGTFNNFASINNLAQFRFVESGTLPIIVNNSTLHCGTSTQFGIFLEETGRPSSFNNCLFTFAGAAGNYGLYATNSTHPVFTPSGTGAAVGRFANTGTTTNLPHYNNPIIPWDGKGTNYDNQISGTPKGYNSTVVTAPPIGRIISINLLNSSTNALVPSEVAGTIPAPCWNNSTLPNEIMTALVDSGSAVVSGATASFYYTNYGYGNSTVTHPAPMDDDSKMMRGNRANSNTPSTTSTLTGLPYGRYDVYVYWGGRSSGESVPATLKVELQLRVSGTYSTVPNSARHITDANRAWDGTYNESTAETAGAAVDGNEYVVFRNLTAPDFRILTTGPSRTGISGIQIVERP